MYRRVLPLLLTAVLLLSGCTAGQKNMPQKTDEKEMTGQPSDMSGEGSMYMDTTENVIYLAGGCFWGMEQLMQSIPGVIDAESGYANVTCEADADYKTVCKGETGFREAVRVEYDPGQVSLDALLLAYFYVIDPTVENRQGNDRGSQYQTGVYYTNESAKETVERIAEIERGRSEKFFVEIGPLKNYYPAEEYHQNYLEKNPNGYCHIPRAEMELFSRLRIDPGDYQKPAAESIRDKLTAEQGQSFPLTYNVLRGGLIGQQPLGSSYVLVKLAAVPMPPPFVGKILSLPSALVIALGYFVIDSNRHHTPVDFDGDLHHIFLLFRFGFCKI